MQPTPVSPLHEIARATARDLKLIAAQRGAENDMGETPDKLTALLDTLRALDTINAPHALMGGGGRWHSCGGPEGNGRHRYRRTFDM